MSKTDLDKSYFVSFCIEQYKAAKGLGGAEAADILFSNGVAEYLQSNYEVLHTQSSQWLMEEVDDFIQRRAQRL